MSKRILLSALALAAMPLVAQAHDDDHGAAPDRMVVVRDAETGKLRAPTAAELETMNAQASRQAPARAGSVLATTLQKTHASGARGVRLTDEFMSYSVITRAADGTLTKQCVEGAQNAQDVLKSNAATAAKE